jgi:hypothetical protein
LSLKRRLKKLVLPGSPHIYRIRFGLARGSLMKLNLQSQLQRLLGLDELEIASTVRRALASAKSAVDVGANDGYYTLVFLRSNAERVIACEPGPVAEELLRNVRVNHYRCEGRLAVERHSIGARSNELGLDKLLADLPRPLLVKIDIDGGEVDALASAGALKDLESSLWVVETHSAELERKCESWFVARGFKTSIIDHAWWRIFVPELRPGPQNRWLIAEGREFPI